VGISGDPVSTLKLFENVNHLNFTLLSDVDGDIMSKLGVPFREGGTRTMEIDGKEVQLPQGVTAARWTFIFDSKGKLVSLDKEVNAAEDSQNVLNFFKNR
jgi:peroxiredoxin